MLQEGTCLRPSWEHPTRLLCFLHCVRLPEAPLHSSVWTKSNKLI